MTSKNEGSGSERQGTTNETMSFTSAEMSFSPFRVMRFSWNSSVGINAHFADAPMQFINNVWFIVNRSISKHDGCFVTKE